MQYWHSCVKLIAERTNWF